MVVANRVVEGYVLAMLNIWKSHIPCTWMLIFVHVHDVHNHLIDDLYLAIGLGVERNGFSELGVQQWPDTRQKCVEEHVVPILGDGLWYHKMDPHTFKEELGITFLYDSLIAWCDNDHLQKLINHQKYTIIAILGGWKAIHVIHQDGFPRSLRRKNRGV